jgi:hypothetical protein
VTLTITGRQMTSDVVPAYATRVGLEAGPEEWMVTGYPGRRLSRNEAITAMTIAEERSKQDPDRALLRTLESEL